MSVAYEIISFIAFYGLIALGLSRLPQAGQ